MDAQSNKCEPSDGSRWQQAAGIFAKEVCTLTILIQPKVLQGLLDECDAAVCAGNFEAFITSIAEMEQLLESILQSLAGKKLDPQLARELEQVLSAGDV